MKKESETRYVSPKVKTVKIRPRAIMCTSPGDGMTMHEKNLGDGGFDEE